MRKLICAAMLAVLPGCSATDVTSDQKAQSSVQGTGGTGSGGSGGSSIGGDSTVHPSQPGGAVATIAVNVAPLPGGRPIQVGDSLGFSAVLKDASGTTLSGRSVNWETSSAGVVRLDWSNGSYAIGRALTAGVANITATSEGKAGTAAVEVR